MARVQKKSTPSTAPTIRQSVSLDANRSDGQRAIRRRNRGGVAEATWAVVNPADLIGAIVAVTSTGCAIRFGYSRDRGAFAVGIIGDGEPFTEFCRPTEDIDLFLRGFADDYGVSKP